MNQVTKLNSYAIIFNCIPADIRYLYEDNEGKRIWKISKGNIPACWLAQLPPQLNARYISIEVEQELLLKALLEAVEGKSISMVVEHSQKGWTHTCTLTALRLGDSVHANSKHHYVVPIKFYEADDVYSDIAVLEWKDVFK